MASSTGATTEGGISSLKSGEGSKPTNSRKRQLVDSDKSTSSVTTSTKRTTADVDLTAEGSQHPLFEESQRQDEFYDEEDSSDESSDEDEDESQSQFKKPKVVLPKDPPAIIPTIPDVKKDKPQRKKVTTKQSARTSGSVTKPIAGGGSTSANTTPRCQSNMSMENLKKLRQQLKKIDVEKLSKMLQGEGLTDFPKNTLFEVSSIVRRNGEHGEYGELCYVTTINSKRKAGKVRVPETALCNLQSDGPCLMFYGGPKTTLKGRTCHDISIMRVPDVTTAEQMKCMADRLRSLGPVGTKASMSGVPLDNFPHNTLFSFKNPTLRAMGMEKKDVLVVDFETDSKDGTTSTTGQLLLPVRLESDVRTAGSGVLLYRGPRLSQEGRTYQDVVVISPKTACSMLMNVSSG